MGRFKKFIAVSILLVILFFVILIIWARVDGKSFVERRASVMLRRPVTVEKVRVVFPGILRLDNLNVEGLLWSDEVEIRCNPLSSLDGALHLGRVRLLNPILTLHRTEDQQIIWAKHAEDSVSVAAESAPRAKPPIAAVIDRLIVDNGRIHFPSHSINDDGMEFSFNQVEGEARNVPLSGQAADVAFTFLAKMEGSDIPFTKDSVKGSGWINWPLRNMDATVGVVNPQGKIDVEVSLNAKNNDMTVRGRVKTRRMGLKSDEAREDSIENMLLQAIQTAGMEVNLEFSFLTKMDRWELRNIDFSGNLNASDEPKTPAEKMEDLKNIGKQFKAVGEQIYDKYKKP